MTKWEKREQKMDELSMRLDTEIKTEDIEQYTQLLKEQIEDLRKRCEIALARYS